ncbi:MAG TPA: protein kinase [Lacipirellulaceae bacterium]|nr:protein kinase [Lacipirellulaceae bacterium]
MADLVGKKLKDFYILRRLGRGAMAEVYLARQLSLDRAVAFKVLNEDLARDPNYVRRFHHEARAAAALVHAGIVQIFEVGEQNGVHYIAQEYVAGRNLGEIARTSGSLSPQLTLDILRQVTAALCKASSEGIVHRDIKPENIILARNGEVKVADFGLARVQGDGGANLTQIGVTMGTPLYMSPEQIEGRELDSRSDIYSLGCTAYHMLAGQPPFTGDSPLSVAVQHLNQPAPALTDRSPGVPPRFAQLVERMMAKRPIDRFSDPAALLAELHALAMEGAEQGWAAKPDYTLLTEVLRAADQRSAATNRLDELMKTTAVSRAKRFPLGWVVATVVGCALFGVSIAILTGPRYLLADAQNGPPQLSSEWAQLYHAKQVDTEAAWQAVITNFPHAPDYYHNLANQGLAYYYIRARDFDKAIKPLESLASKEKFQTFGIAGLVVVYTQLGDDEEAKNQYARLTEEMKTSLAQQAPQMAELLTKSLDELADREADRALLGP